MMKANVSGVRSNLRILIRRNNLAKDEAHYKGFLFDEMGLNVVYKGIKASKNFSFNSLVKRE